MTPLARTAVALGVLVSFAGPASAQDRLADAYKREYAFLEAEKRALTARIAEEKASAARRITAAKTEIASLQGAVVATSNQAETIQELMLTADRNIETLDESGDALSEIVVRADSTYDKVGVALPASKVDGRAAMLTQIRFAFESAPGVLATQSSVRTETGAYYDAAGRRVEGEVLRVGNVAAYGLADGASGVLAPAGQGELKLWPADRSADAARALAAGQSVSSLPMFLFESLDKNAKRKKSKTLREFIDTGGVIGWVIVGLGLVALAMIVARFGLLLFATFAGSRTLPPVLARLNRGDTQGAIDIASKSKSATGRVLTTTLRNAEADRAVLEDAVAEAVLAEQPTLARFGSAILVVAAVSPLLGLLGTVTGMISTFDIITEFGTGNPKLLSGGISEALVTTELGLIVAIPALLVGHLLSGMAERARDNLDAAALAAVNRLHGIRVDDEAGEDKDAPSLGASTGEAIADPA